MAQEIRVPKGLYNVVIGETSIAKSGSDGSLIYRGYKIEDLFKNTSYEETAYLILNGMLPTRAELDRFKETLRRERAVPASVYKGLGNVSANATEMDLVRTAVSMLGCVESTRPTEEQRDSLIAKMPVLVANCHRIKEGKQPVSAASDQDTAYAMLEMITGSKPSSAEVRAFEQELIFYMEHDMNASTFTVTVVASTLADPYSAVTAGVSALKGPLHGGANEKAIEMLLAIGSKSNAKSYIEGILAKNQKVYGFGHRVYKKVDPRAQLSKKILEQLVSDNHSYRQLYDTAVEVEKIMWDLKKLPANLDFYAAPVFYVLNVPVPMYTPIFAAARVVGWMAHYYEQLSDNKIIRPDVEYRGEVNRVYVPLNQR